MLEPRIRPSYIHHDFMRRIALFKNVVFADVLVQSFQVVQRADATDLIEGNVDRNSVSE